MLPKSINRLRKPNFNTHAKQGPEIVAVKCKTHAIYGILTYIWPYTTISLSLYVYIYIYHTHTHHHICIYIYTYLYIYIYIFICPGIFHTYVGFITASQHAIQNASLGAHILSLSTHPTTCGAAPGCRFMVSTSMKHVLRQQQVSQRGGASTCTQMAYSLRHVTKSLSYEPYR